MEILLCGCESTSVLHLPSANRALRVVALNPLLESDNNSTCPAISSYFRGSTTPGNLIKKTNSCCGSAIVQKSEVAGLAAV